VVSGNGDKSVPLHIATPRTAESKGVVDAAARAVREASYPEKLQSIPALSRAADCRANGVRASAIRRLFEQKQQLDEFPYVSRKNAASRGTTDEARPPSRPWFSKLKVS
jgi:hypothetical protein